MTDDQRGRVHPDRGLLAHPGMYGNGGQWGGFNSFTAPPEGNSISSINDTTTIAVDMQQAKISPQFYEAPLA